MSGSRLITDSTGLPPLRLQPGQHAPSIKHDDPESMKPQIVTEAHIRIFDLGKAKDIQDYADIWTKATRGHVLISAEDRHWCEDTQNFKVLLRWGELFQELPKGA